MITMSYSSVDAFLAMGIADDRQYFDSAYNGWNEGIGLATAKKLAQLGIHVLVVGRNARRGKKAVEEIRTAGGKADFISSELLGADSAREVARKAIELGSGHVDILINNAGIYPFGPTHEMT